MAKENEAAPDEQPEITETTLTIEFGATLAVQAGDDSRYHDWIRPATSFSTRWNGVPTEQQIATATEFINKAILAPLLGDIIATAQQRLTEARQGRR